MLLYQFDDFFFLDSYWSLFKLFNLFLKIFHFLLNLVILLLALLPLLFSRRPSRDLPMGDGHSEAFFQLTHEIIATEDCLFGADSGSRALRLGTF